MSKLRTAGAARTVKVVGAVLAGVIAIQATFSLAGLMARGDTVVPTALPEQISRFEVVDLPGSITITGGDGTNNRIVEQRTSALRSPDSALFIDGGTVRFSADCAWFDEWCGLDLQAFVDASAPLTASSSGGDLTVRQMRAPIDLRSSAGDVTVIDATGDARLESSAGDVTVRGLRAAQVEARSSAGDVTIDLLSQATSVTADSSAGDVEIVVPEGEPYRVEASTSAGQIRTEIATDPAATRVIRATSSAGDVIIRYASR